MIQVSSNIFTYYVRLMTDFSVFTVRAIYEFWLFTWVVSAIVMCKLLPFSFFIMVYIQVHLRNFHDK
jgi:hypothetical protein